LIAKKISSIGIGIIVIFLFCLIFTQHDHADCSKGDQNSSDPAIYYTLCVSPSIDLDWIMLVRDLNIIDKDCQAHHANDQSINRSIEANDHIHNHINCTTNCQINLFIDTNDCIYNHIKYINCEEKEKEGKVIL
jgi:hypothetical protein